MITIQQVRQQIGVLESISANNERLIQLREYVKDPIFRKVLTYALDSRLTFHVKKFPKYQGPATTTPDEKIFNFLDTLNSKSGASNVEKKLLFDLSSSDPDTYEMVRRICNKDLKCGCGVKTVNKALLEENLPPIFYIPYCRCSTDSKIKNIIFPAICQEKEDGMFANIFIFEDGKIDILTREGKPVHQLELLKKRLRKRLPAEGFGRVYTGELLIMGPDLIPFSRKKGNGIFNSCLQKTADQGLANNAFISVWDSIPIKDFWDYKCTTPLEDRWAFINLLASKVQDKTVMRLVNSEIVNSLEEAYAYYFKMRAKGGEGAVVKNWSMIWSDHTSPNQIKLKNVIDVDLEIVGIYKGNTGSKYEQCLGGLKCQTRCGRLTVNVGGGFSDKERGYHPVTKDHKHAIESGTKWINGKKAKKALKRWENEIGNIIASESESVIKSKVSDIYSLYQPRYNEIRSDKNVADTLQEILER